jgi:hypothetical protein
MLMLIFFVYTRALAVREIYRDLPYYNNKHALSSSVWYQAWIPSRWVYGWHLRKWEVIDRSSIGEGEGEGEKKCVSF